MSLFCTQICIKYSRFITCQSNTSKGRGHDSLPTWNPQNGGMLISQPVSGCLTNHSKLCMSRMFNNQSRRTSIYRLQWRPSFGFEISVSSTLMTSGDPVILYHSKFTEVMWPCAHPLREKSATNALVLVNVNVHQIWSAYFYPFQRYDWGPTIFGQTSVKRFALCYRTVVCLVLSLCL